MVLSACAWVVIVVGVQCEMRGPCGVLTMGCADMVWEGMVRGHGGRSHGLGNAALEGGKGLSVLQRCEEIWSGLFPADLAGRTGGVRWEAR